MIHYRGVDLNPTTGKLVTDLIGGYFEPPTVRGTDWTIPGARYRELRARVDDVRRLELRVHVIGKGADEQSRSEDWHTSMLALMATLQLDDAPGELEVGDGYLGFAAGATATINARAVSIASGPILNCASYQRLAVVLEAIEDWQLES